MRAYKGFTSEIVSVLGNGNEKACTFKPGRTYYEKQSKTAREGYHCCENPFDCLGYYELNGKNRFFEVEAAGDIDEDGMSRIACTKLTLVKELSRLEFVMAGIQYMIEHPLRSGWQQHYYNVTVQGDEAEAAGEGGVAIARGRNPKVKGPEGSILALLVEDEAGYIVEAKIFIPQKDKGNADVWCRVGNDRKVEVIQHEKKAG